MIRARNAKKLVAAKVASPTSKRPRKSTPLGNDNWEGFDSSEEENEKSEWDRKIERTLLRRAPGKEKEDDESSEIDYSAEDLQVEEDDDELNIEHSDEEYVHDDLDETPLPTIARIEERYEELRSMWFPGIDEEGREYYDRLQRNYEDVDYRDLTKEDIESCYKYNSLIIEHLLASVAKYQERLFLRNELGEHTFGEQIKRDANKMLLLNVQTRDLLLAMFRQRVTVNSYPNSLGETNLPIMRLPVMTTKQKILTELYQRCAEMGYRKRGTMLYEPIYSAKGCYTHAYKECMEIMDFVTKECNRSLSLDNWLYVSGSNKGTRTTFGDLAASLELFVDPQLKKLKRDRHKFSFKNGLFSTKIMENVEGRPGQKRVTHRFYSYDDPAIDKVDAGLISAKYFDLEYVPYDDDFDWADIPTPMLDHIFRTQYEGHEDYDNIYRFFLMNIGRMLFAHGDLDDWQFMVDFIGPAGTGKSTVVTHIMQVFYEPENVGIISNKIESQFGLGGILYDKEIFITLGGELDKNCQLPTAQMLQMVSGDSMTCAVKNIKNPIQLLAWPTHIATAENEFPLAWKDTGGNVLRRHLMFRFMKRVRATISNLPDQLKLEMPNIIQKCVRAYHYYVNRYGLYGPKPTDVWNFCPPYFKVNREKLAQTANMLHSFTTESGRICLSSDLVVSEADFFAEYRDYCRSRSVRSNITTKDIQYDGLVQDLNHLYKMNISYEPRSHFEYGGEIHYNQHYFFGMGLSSRISVEERELIYVRNNQRFAGEEEEEWGADDNNSNNE